MIANWLGAEAAAALVLSLKVAVWSTLLSLPVGLVTGYALARWRFPGRQVLNGLVHLPLVLPPVVTGYLLLGAFGPGGILSTLGPLVLFRWTGAALAAAIMAFPFLVRAIRLSVEAVDSRLEEAAATFGASPARVFATVTLPLILPGILTGAILAFAKAMGEFGATITFVANIPGETQTLPSAIYALLQVPGGEAAAARLVLVSVAVAMVALALAEWLSRAVARRIGGA